MKVLTDQTAAAVLPEYRPGWFDGVGMLGVGEGGPSSRWPVHPPLGALRSASPPTHTHTHYTVPAGGSITSHRVPRPHTVAAGGEPRKTSQPLHAAGFATAPAPPMESRRPVWWRRAAGAYPIPWPSAARDVRPLTGGRWRRRRAVGVSEWEWLEEGNERKTPLIRRRWSACIGARSISCQGRGGGRGRKGCCTVQCVVGGEFL